MTYAQAHGKLFKNKEMNKMYLAENHRYWMEINLPFPAILARQSYDAVIDEGTDTNIDF